MRFLLHPTTKTTTTTTNAAAKAAATATALFQNPADTVVISTSSSTTTTKTLTNRPTRRPGDGGGGVVVVKAWGQQCSPHCGCVLRLDATWNHDSGIIQSAQYTAKQVMCTSSVVLSDNHQNRGCGLQRRQSDRRPLLTTLRAKPMLQPCHCPSLHHLASAWVQYLVGKSCFKLSSVLLEFQSHRASEATRHTVLRAQQLNVADIQCFDLVEEAVTGLLKGHVPKPRQQQQQFQQQPFQSWQGLPRTTTSSTTSSNLNQSRVGPKTARTDGFVVHGEEEDDYDHGVQHWMGPPFESRYHPSTTHHATLRFFDEQVQAAQQRQQQQQQQQQRRRKRMPTDWVSYVDEQNQQQSA